MKAHLLKGSRSINIRYTYTMLEFLLKRHGIEIAADIPTADIVLASACDVASYRLVKDARKAAGDKPIFMGGCESFTGTSWLAWADYVWVGEGFEFFEVLKGGAWADLINHRSIISKEKRTAVPSTKINWEEIPLMKGGKNTYYIMMSRGCKRKCKFCYVSWANLHQLAPPPFQHHVLDSIKQLPKGASVHYISNDHTGLLMNERVKCPSVRAVDFLKQWENFKHIKFAHFGIERFSEWGRREWGKPISNADLRQIIDLTAQMGREVELFFIIGLPSTHEEFEEFAEIVPAGVSLTPKLKIKTTYFEPAAHTPWERYDLTKLTEFDGSEAIKRLLAKNRRFQKFANRGLPTTMWRVLFHRCNETEVERLGPPPKKMAVANFIEGVKGKGLGHLLDGQQEVLPWEGIEVPYQYKRKGAKKVAL